MRKYTIAMSVRFACFIACIFTPGWWILIPAIGAVILPYLAVVIANVSSRPSGVMEAPDRYALPAAPTRDLPGSAPDAPTKDADA